MQSRQQSRGCSCPTCTSHRMLKLDKDNNVNIQVFSVKELPTPIDVVPMAKQYSRCCSLIAYLLYFSVVLGEVSG